VFRPEPAPLMVSDLPKPASGSRDRHHVLELFESQGVREGFAWGRIDAEGAEKLKASTECRTRGRLASLNAKENGCDANV